MHRGSALAETAGRKEAAGQVPAASFRDAAARSERQLLMRRFASSTASKS